MLSLIDQTGRNFTLAHTPQRIVSLVPSQTELLAYLSLDEAVVGITKFCVHPEDWFRSKTRIGGTKTVHLEKIFELEPDLILANKEENVREQVESLAQNIPTYVSDVNTLEDALAMIGDVGLITGKEMQANDLVQRLQEQFAALKPQRPLSAAYLIWQEPWMTVGGDTFISNMLECAGFQNVFGNRSRYPEVTLQELQALSPEVLLLSSEPYPFREKHMSLLQPHMPKTKIILVDGELFSWYGSRLLYAPEYFKTLHRQL